MIIVFEENSTGYYYSGGYDFQTFGKIPQGTITGEGTIIRNARVCNIDVWRLVRSPGGTRIR